MGRPGTVLCKEHYEMLEKEHWEFPSFSFSDCDICGKEFYRWLCDDPKDVLKELEDIALRNVKR